MDSESNGQLSVKKIIEALLFASCEPITLKKIKNILTDFGSFDMREIKEAIAGLEREYEGRAFQIAELAGGVVLQTRNEFAPFVRKLSCFGRDDKLSRSALEVLAIVAYRQPVTRVKIEEIRGVDSGGVIYSLLERGLIEPAGKLDVPGRPILFRVTKSFLKHFGLRDLKELPNVDSHGRGKTVSCPG